MFADTIDYVAWLFATSPTWLDMVNFGLYMFTAGVTYMLIANDRAEV